MRQFDRIHALLERWGFVTGWELTARGELLSRVFHESDLLCALAIDEGLFDGLDPSELAGLVSMVTYEHRSKEPPPPPWFPTRRVRDRADRLERLARSVMNDEARNGVGTTRMPDPTFVALAHAWAAGESLDVVLEDELLSGGDFVRNIKTLMDLLRQARVLAPDDRQVTLAADRIATALLFQSMFAISSGKLDEAQRFIDGAKSLGVKHLALSRAEYELAKARHEAMRTRGSREELRQKTPGS